MFYSLTGKLVHMEPGVVAIECGGVAFKCFTSMNTQKNMPRIGETATVYTHLNVREDALDLYGFSTKSELNCYKMLTTISGVGPKAALSILSNVSPEQFALCVATGDSKVFTAAKGIGAKTAQRIVLELKDKITNEQLEGSVGAANPAVSGIASGRGNLSEAISALVVLGYPQAQAAHVVAAMDAELPVEELIKSALKALAGQV